MQLKDQAAIVTGGASGLGAATARRLAAQGAKVAVCDLNAKLAETVAAEIGGVAVICDVSDAASAEAAIAKAAAAHGPARVLVNCAGIGVAKRVIGMEGRHCRHDAADRARTGAVRDSRADDRARTVPHAAARQSAAGSAGLAS